MSASDGRKVKSARPGQTFPQRLAQLRAELDASLAAAKQKHATALALITENRDRRAAENRSEYARSVQAARAEHDREWDALASSGVRGSAS